MNARIKMGAAGLAAVVTAIIMPAVAQAQEPLVVERQTNLPVIYVSYADLNLAEQAGLDRLNRRVRTAATRLCIQPGPQPLFGVMLDRACRTEAIAGADRQIALAVSSFDSTQLASASDRKIAVALR